MLERLFPEHQEEHDQYRVAKQFLVSLSKNENSRITLVIEYLNKILHLFGYVKEKKTLEELIPFIEELIREKLPNLHI